MTAFSQQSFYLFFNPTNMFVVDLIESGGDRLRIPSGLARQLAAALGDSLLGGAHVEVVGHSHGSLVLQNAMFVLAGLNYGGSLVASAFGPAANESTFTAGARGMGGTVGYFFPRSDDPVAMWVGMNATGVSDLFKSLLMLPSVMYGSCATSTHSSCAYFK